MNFDLRNKATAGFILALVLVLVIGVISWRSNYQQEASARTVRHTQEVLTRLESLLSDMTDSEAEVRGFIITGDERYLDSAQAYLESVDREYHALLMLTADNPGQQAILAGLKSLLDAHAGGLRTIIELWRSQGFEAAVETLVSESEKSLRENIHHAIRDMQRTERELLSLRDAATATSAKTTRLLIVIGSLTAAAVIIIALLIIRRDYNHLRHTQTALRESEENLDITLNSIGDAILAVDTEGRITRMNPVAEGLTGWAESEALGRPVGDVFRIINEVTRQAAMIPVDKVLRTGEIQGLANHTALIARDGTECAIADSAAPICDADGRLRGVVLAFRDVSKERAAELALQASEARYRQFIEQSPYGVFVQCEGRFVFLNPKAVALLGGSAEAELLGRPVLDFLHTDSRAVVRERIRRLNEERIAAAPLEEKWLRLDGTVFFGEATAVPYEHEGRPAALVLLQDVTARKVAEEQLDRLFSLSLDMLCISSSDGYFKRVNPAFTLTLGWDIEEMLTMPFLDFVHPDDEAATLEEVERQVVRGEKVLHFENRYRHKDGSWRVLSWRSVPQDGGLMFATARDVTRERQAEDEIRQLNADLQRRVEERTAALNALHTKEEEIRAILDNLFDCVITFDARGTLKSANPVLTRILDYAPEEIIGQNVSLLFPEPHNSGRDAGLEHDGRAGEAWIIGSGSEVEGRHKDGKLIPLELAVSEYVVHGERVFVCTLRDTRERKRFIAELTQARADAELASRAKSAFLATMSHEIRTPMNGVVGMVEVLAHSRLSEHQVDLVGTIRESASSLLGIIDDILDFSKIEAGRLEIVRVAISVVDLVEGLCASLVPVAAKRDADLHLFVSPEVPDQVLSDDLRLRQVLYNLVGNAIKFSGNRPGLRGHVSIRTEIAQAAPLRLRFRIADNGIGMAPEILKNLFTPFTQAEISTTRRFGGTGLGLAICKRLVDLMDGEMSVESTPGAGSIFTVILPVERAPEQPVQPMPDLTGIECILVQSEEYAMDDVSAYLEYAGIRVRHAADTAAAVRAASGAAGIVVVIQYLGREQSAPDSFSGTEANLRTLLITRGRLSRTRIETPGVVTMDGDVLRRQVLLRAVAVAAGHASPEVVGHGDGNAVMGPEPTAPTIVEARAQGRLILVAEDDDINQKVILQQLALLGYAAEVAGDGEEALRLWRNEQQRYALLLTDLHMPRMDGYTLAKTIRREEVAPGRMPILVLTANALRGEAHRARAAGMDEFLTKPVQLHLLKGALEKWLPPAGDTSARMSTASISRDRPSIQAVDVSVLKGLIGDDAATVSGILSQFLAAVGRLASELRSALAAGEMQMVGAIAHKLKSSARSVGALSLGELCAELETAGKAGIETAISQRMVQFEVAVAAVEADITRLLAERPYLRGD